MTPLKNTASAFPTPAHFLFGVFKSLITHALGLNKVKDPIWYCCNLHAGPLEETHCIFCGEELYLPSYWLEELQRAVRVTGAEPLNVYRKPHQRNGAIADSTHSQWASSRDGYQALILRLHREGTIFARKIALIDHVSPAVISAYKLYIRKRFIKPDLPLSE